MVDAPERCKSRLVLWVALPLVGLLAVAGFLTIRTVSSENQARVGQQLSDEARLANFSVNAFFARQMTLMEQAETTPVFERYLTAHAVLGPSGDNPYLNELRTVIDNVQATSRGQFLVTWVSDLRSGTMFRSSNAQSDAGKVWDPASSPWFATVKTATQPFLTAPYTDPFSGREVVSLLCPVTSKTTGEVLGVFGADLDLEQLGPILQSACPSGEDHLVLIASDDTVVYHQTPSFLHRRMDELPYSKDIIAAVRDNKAGSYVFSRDGVDMQGTLSTLGDGNWLVLSELSQREIDKLMSSTITQLGACFLLALILLVGSGVLLRKLLIRQEKNGLFLEAEVEKRTHSLLRQDAMLWTVNDIAKKLLATDAKQAFNEIISDCLRMIGESTGGNRVYIWKDVTNKQGELCCIQTYEWVRNAVPIQDNEIFENVPYAALPTFQRMLDQGVCLNSHVRDLTESERVVLEPQGIKTLLIAPILIDKVRWGFIGVDNCESVERFSELAEKILLISGFMMASAILRQTTETQLRETEELVQAMFDATPLCCNVWNSHDELLTCNEGAVRLFGVDSKQEFLERFKEFSPPLQPDGRSSAEFAEGYIREAFRTGYLTFEWLHRSAQGEPLPAQVTLVRIRYKNEDALAAYVRDLRELKAEEAQRHDAEDRTQIMLNAMPLCCNFWNKDFRNLACNDAAPLLFGLKSQQEYLERFFELSPAIQPGGTPSSDMALEKITQAFNEGFARFEWLHQNLEGMPIPSEITLVRVWYKNEYIVVGYTRDLRELKAMLEEVRYVQQELALARDEAVAHSTAKSDFLARMSHEIRTPMNAIVGMSELMLRSDLSVKAREHARAIKQAGAHLLSLINDILDFSKIESGKLEISNIDYLLASLINDTINIIRVRMMEKPLLFTVNIDPELPNNLVGDDIRLRQILLNVLNNAVKYTEQGFISLTIEGEKIDETSLRLRMVVTDSGVGIKEDDLANLYGQFVQFDSVKNKGVEGSGLGLAITRSLCRAMGGDIEVESEYGKGSVFTVHLVQGYSGDEHLATVEEAHEQQVLLFEPRMLIAESIAASLTRLGVRHTMVTNQSAFYEQLEAATYSFIFMSTLMFETTRALLERKRMLHTVVVFKEHGESVSHTSVKTVSMPLYAINLANVLNGVGELLDVAASDISIRFTAPKAKVLVVDDINTNLMVAEGLMAPYCMCIDLCESGEEALELVKTTAYDIVFMDHMMPGMNGIEATLAIRELPECQNLPIVALTANAVSGIREVFLANGFSDFLAKPIETSKLNAVLERWIPRSKQEKTTPATGRQEPNASPVFAIDGVDVRQGLVMTGGSVERYLSILATYHGDGLARVPELRSTLEQGDLGLYATYVHALKSASASIGAVEVADLAKQLEMAAKRGDADFLQQHTEAFLRDFTKILENIGYIITAQHSGSPAESLSDTELQTALHELKEALDTLDGVAADALLGRLRKHKSDETTAEAIRQIADHVLLCDYDEAVEIIDRLLAAK